MRNVWKIIITVMLTAILVGSGVYYILANRAEEQKKEMEKKVTTLEEKVKDLQNTSIESNNTEEGLISSDEDTNNETADWKTYINNEHGFSLKYPSHWTSDNNTFNNEVVLIGPSSTSTAETRVLVSQEVSIADFIKSWSTDSNPYNLDELISEIGTKVGSVDIDGISSTKFLEPALGGNNFDIVIPKENNIIFIQFIGRDYLNDTEQQILSSFRFSK